MKKFALLLFLAWACSSPVPTAQQVVDEAISISGTYALSKATATFDFRGIQYGYESNAGQYNYTRTQLDSVGNEVKDVLTNNGLKRFINEEETEITDKKRAAYSASVNSVIYFAFLPSSLNDAAVNKSLEGTVKINGRSYHKVKVTFDSEGGGEDFEDIFYYWFDTENYNMDYLAYSYNEDHGRGIRFRVAYNRRKVNGIVMQDYRNMKPIIDGTVPLSEIDQAYQNNKLEELSLIELKDVVISTR